MRNRLFLFVVCLALQLVCGGGAHAIEDEATTTPGFQFNVTANEDILWLAVGRYEKLNTDENKQRWLQRFAYQRAESEDITPTYKIEPQLGKITHAAVADQDLHVFYINEKQKSSHYRYTLQRSVREKQLPGRPVPEAIAGTVKDDLACLWAVVDAQTANQVESEYLRRQAQQTTQTAPGATTPSITTIPAKQPSLSPRAEQSFHLVQYRGRYWRPGFPAPDSYKKSARTWLCISGGKLHLLWQENADELQIEYASGGEEGWEQHASVDLHKPISDGFAAVTNMQLYFVAALPDPGNPDRIQLQPWRWTNGQAKDGKNGWRQIETLRTAEETELSLPAEVGAFGGRFVVLTRRDDKPMVGFWPTTGGTSSKTLTEIPLIRRDQKQEMQRNIREMLILFSVAILLLLVWWRRQDSFSIPVALPEGLMVSGTAKRAIAGVLDILPALLLVGWWYYEPFTNFISKYWTAVHSAAPPEQIEAVSGLGGLYIASIIFRLLYIVYCMLFELKMQATPGKRLLGCSVATEQGERAHPYQIVIRNLTKMIEFDPALQIWPFLLIIFFTQNRQRLGDLIARTIVVEKQPVTQQHARKPEAADQTEEEQSNQEQSEGQEESEQEQNKN